MTKYYVIGQDGVKTEVVKEVYDMLKRGYRVLLKEDYLDFPAFKEDEEVDDDAIAPQYEKKVKKKS